MLAFIVAGTIEGFVTPSGLPTSMRVAIGVAVLRRLLDLRRRSSAAAPPPSATPAPSASTTSLEKQRARDRARPRRTTSSARRAPSDGRHGVWRRVSRSPARDGPPSRAAAHRLRQGRTAELEEPSRRATRPGRRGLDLEVGVGEARGELAGRRVDDGGAEAAEAGRGAVALGEGHRGRGGAVGLADVARAARWPSGRRRGRARRRPPRRGAARSAAAPAAATPPPPARRGR